MTKKLTSSYLVKTLVIFSLIALVASCGGGGGASGGSPDTTKAEITGVAATGAPISFRPITLIDSNGKTAETETDVFGAFTIDVTDYSAPFLLQVVLTNPGAAALFAFAHTIGIVNITPLTNLAFYEAIDRGDPSLFFDSGDISSVSEDKIEMGKNVVLDNFSEELSNEGLDLASYDPVTSVFQADGRGADAVLDNHEITIGLGEVTLKKRDSTGALMDSKRYRDPLTAMAEDLFQLQLSRLLVYNVWTQPFCAKDSLNKSDWKCVDTYTGYDPYGAPGHTGIDIQTKDVGGMVDDDELEVPAHAFYAISEGEVIRAGGGSVNTIAIYDRKNDMTTLYLHAQSVSVEVGEPIKYGQLLGVQGREGYSAIPQKAFGYHVHLGFRNGRVDRDLTSQDHYTLDPVRTYYAYYQSLANQLSIPSITNVNPNPVIGKNGKQNFLVTGENFISTTTVTLRDKDGDGGIYDKSTVITRTASTGIELSVDFTEEVDGWTVEVNNGSRYSGTFPFQVEAPLVPDAPENVTATAGNRKILINWTQNSAVDSYDLYYSTIPGQGMTGSLISNVSAPYFHEGLDLGVEYFYVLVASNVTSDSLLSDEVSAIPTDSNTGAQKLSGTVKDADTGEGIPNARVKTEFVLDGQNSVIDTTTDIFGAYVLGVDNNMLPGHFLVTVSAEGYVPETEDVTNVTSLLNFNLSKLDSNVVVLEIDPVLHHLGDDFFGGAINSQFQKRSEGEVYEKEFVLTEEQAQSSVIRIKLVAKGLQEDNLLLVNDVPVGILNDSPSDGSFQGLSGELPVDAFRSGVNTIRIESARSSSGDLDDFEFSNVTLELSLP